MDAPLARPVDLVERPQLVEQPVGFLEPAHAGEPGGLDQRLDPVPEVHPLQPVVPQSADFLLDLVVQCQRLARHRLLEVLVAGGQQPVPLFDRLHAFAELDDVRLELGEPRRNPPTGQAVPEPDQRRYHDGRGQASDGDQQAR